MVPFGMSRLGSIDSSAASGSSSIARKNQMAKGSALKMPGIPNGRKLEFPGSGSMFVSRLESNFGIAVTKKIARTASESRQITTENLMVASMPTMFRPTKIR